VISNLVTSPHCVVYINSVPFARCCGLTYDAASPRRELKGIDTLHPVELIPLGVSLHGTFQAYRLHQDGGAEAAGLIATWGKITRGKYFSLMVLDRSTDSVLVQADRCEVTNQSWTIQPKQFVLGTVAFSGLDYNNDSE
jgi:cytosine/adenosine deaminase-related metal-dependent hydrolase